MKKCTLGFLLISISMYSVLYAEYRLNFFVGDVRVEANGKQLELRSGMIVPESAIIITGKNSQAHLFDTVRGGALNIRPEARVAVSSLDASSASKTRMSFFERLKKEHRAYGTSSVGAVRGTEEGKMDLDWVTDDEPAPKAKDRSSEWSLFEKGEFERIVPMTKGAADHEGIFLNAASSYYLEGPGAAEKASAALEKLVRDAPGSSLLSESRRVLAVINYEKASYDSSYSLMKEAVRHVSEGDIGETGYYILTQSSFFTNRSEEGRSYLRKMKRYHRSSPLLEKIVTR